MTVATVITSMQAAKLKEIDSNAVQEKKERKTDKNTRCINPNPIRWATCCRESGEAQRRVRAAAICTCLFPLNHSGIIYQQFFDPMRRYLALFIVPNGGEDASAGVRWYQICNFALKSDEVDRKYYFRSVLEKFKPTNS